MTPNLGKVSEFRLEPDGRRSVRIGCDVRSIPAAGKYVLADLPTDQDALLPAPLFAQEIYPDGFLAAPDERPLPPSWEIGAVLRLRGPLGRGFDLPGVTRNLALAAIGDTPARLLPLVGRAGSTALFTDLPVPDLPTRVEVQPLAALPEALGWADFLAVDIPLERIGELAAILGQRSPASGQALVHAQMPCGGLAECGVCTLKIGRRSVLLCVEGPVVGLAKVMGYGVF